MNLREKYGEWGIILGATEGVGNVSGSVPDNGCSLSKKGDAAVDDQGHRKGIRVRRIHRFPRAERPS